MTPAQLAVERDRLLEGGRSLAEIARMQAFADAALLEAYLALALGRGVTLEAAAADAGLSVAEWVRRAVDAQLDALGVRE